MAKGYRGGAGGFGGGANMNNMLKQVQKMQQEMQQEAEATEKKTVETSVGGGAVTVVMTGKHILESVKIDPAVIDPDDVEMLEDLIMSAVNEASKKVDEMMESTMGKFTSGLNIPGMPGLF